MVREAEFRGQRFRERITFHAQQLIVYERIAGAAKGVITNSIEADENGNLLLRFMFCLEMEDLDSGSDQERKHAADTEPHYLLSTNVTLDAIRRMVADGLL